MAKARAKAASQAVPQAAESQGLAHRIGWLCLLALVVWTPICIAAIPQSLGGLRVADPIDLPKTVLFLSLSGLSLAALCVSMIRKESELYWHPVMWVLLGISSWAVVSTLFSSSPELSVWGSYNRNDGLVAIWGYTLLAFLGIQFVRSRRQLRTLMVAAVVSGLIVSGYALLQQVGIDPYGWINDLGRVFSSFGNPDMLGTYLMFPLALAAGLALTEERRNHALGWWAAVAVVSAALLATQTRGAWIGAIALALALGFAGWSGRGAFTPRRIAAVSLGAVLFLAAAAVIVVFARPGIVGGASDFSALAERLSNGRNVIWSIGWHAWLARPITGWGPDSFQRAFDSVAGAEWYSLVQGVQSADNAHNFLLQRLVVLGLPGFALTVWALVQTAIQSFRQLAAKSGSERILQASVWAAMVGLTIALLTGVSVTFVSMWLWLAVGILLAPLARPVALPPKAVSAALAVLGVALAIWSFTWLVADFYVAQATALPAGPAQVAGFQAAVHLNPLGQGYRWRTAEVMLNATLAERQSLTPEQFDAAMQRVLAEYKSAADADPGDALVRVAYANVLLGFAAQHPGSETLQMAVSVAERARQLAPLNPAVLVSVAKAYRLAGRMPEANAAARLARSIAPEYSMQTLGTLGSGSSTTP